MARQAFVPITMGASGSASLALNGFLVTEAGFPPLARLAPHVHERATLAVMLEGSFDLSITNRVYPCEPGCVVTEPAEERHGNALGRAGAHVLVVQPEPTALDRLGPSGGMFEDVRYAARGPVSGVAWRIVRELRSPDSATPLEVEGLVLEMLALVSRQGQLERRARQAPPWLARTRELLHATFRQPPPMDELAREAGVHPDYLARAFRVRFGVPVGTYVRRLRLEWAAARLAGTEEPIAQIALDAGFADQSHFTRAFKRHAGMTPGDYRRGPEIRVTS
jgi:AraC family transcriptional regulator